MCSLLEDAYTACHDAKMKKGFIKGKKWKLVERPSHPPDLNTIEHAFDLFLGE